MKGRPASAPLFQDRRILVNGHAIYTMVADQAPAAPTLILIHGVIVSHRYLMPTARLLAETHHVYVPDLPGYGKSYKPRKALSVPELADFLVDFMDELKLEQAVLLGNSFGCQILVDVAARYPQRVERLILVGPTIDPAASSFPRQAVRLMLDVRHERPSLPFVLLRDVLEMGIPRAIGYIRAMLRDRIETKLPLVKAPTLLARGERDTVVPQRWAEEATRLLPEGRLVVIPGAPHATNYSAPEALARVTREFLAD